MSLNHLATHQRLVRVATGLGWAAIKSPILWGLFSRSIAPTDWITAQNVCIVMLWTRHAGHEDTKLSLELPLTRSISPNLQSLILVILLLKHETRKHVNELRQDPCLVQATVWPVLSDWVMAGCTPGHHVFTPNDDTHHYYDWKSDVKTNWNFHLRDGFPRPQ